MGTLVLPLFLLASAGASDAGTCGPQVDAPAAAVNDKPLLEKMAPNVKAGEILRFRDLGWGVQCLAFSPNGAFVAAGKMDETLLVFDLGGKRQVANTGRIDKLGQITALAFSPDGKKLLVGGYQGRILVWDFRADGTLGAMDKFSGHSREIRSIHVSPDSRRVLSGSSEKRARYWDLQTRRELFAFDEFRGGVSAVYLARNGRQGLASDGQTLALLNLEKGGVLQSMKLTRSYHAAVIFSPDGKRVAAADGRRIRIWEIKSGKEFAPLEHKTIHRGIAFSPGGRYLLSASGGHVNLWDTLTSRKRYELDTLHPILPPNVLAYAPDGAHFAAIPDAAGQELQIMRVAGDVKDRNK